jgi:8-amino-7-oxononanoate synthase
MEREHWAEEELESIRQQGLERRLQACGNLGGKISVDGREYLNFSSNDYLALSRHPRVREAAASALSKYGAGSGASRLVTGTLPIHEELEARLAELKGYPACLVFGSGYLANCGAIPSVVGRNDEVFADRLVHASVLDAIALSRARLRRFRHNDAAHLDELLQQPASGRRLVVTESVFSMDGDIAPLQDLDRVASQHGAMLMADEAHATGVFGPGGSGLVREAGLEKSVTLSMATLSKALGGYGGVVACSAVLRDLMVNRARSFIYTTALPPSVVGAALGALDVLRDELGLGEELLRRAARFREALASAGLDTHRSESQIIPVVVGGNEETLRLAARLREQGLIAVAIRPPTVPTGTARLRLSVTLAHTDEDLARAAEVIIGVARAEGLV